MDNMNNQVFKICVLLSTYNGEKYIGDQIDSILSQNGVETELFVRDDGSQDKTVNILNKYAQKYHNIHVFPESNIGVQQSFLKLAVYAKETEADYYAFADQDDVWLPAKLKEAADKLREADNMRPAVYFSNLMIADEQLKEIGKVYSAFPEISKKGSVVRNYAYGCTMVFNRCALEHFVKNQNARMWMHDYWLYLVGLFLGNIIYDDEAYILYRQHENNAVGVKHSFRSEIKRKMHSVTLLRKRPREDMAKDFLSTFALEIKTEDAAMLKQFCEYRKRISSRMRSAFDKEYRQYDRKTNFFLTIRFLIGSV